MNKAILRYKWYIFVCKMFSGTKSWFKMLGEKVRAPRERMHMTMIPLEKKVDAPSQKVLPMDVVDELIEMAAAQAVLKECGCRAGGRCQDYPQEIGCIVLGSTVNDLDPYIGKIVSKDEARAHVRKALDAKLYPLISHYERAAMFYSLDLNRMLVLCFCCPCHCVARNAAKVSEGLDNSFYSNTEGMAGVSVRFDESKCNACGKCVDGCFANAITLEDGKIRFDADKCKGCGHCAYICDTFSVDYNLTDVQSVVQALTANTNIT